MKELKNTEEFNEMVKGGKPILLDFYADWCGPCQAQLPIVEELAALHKDDFVIAKVNVDKNRALAQEFKVRSIPALFFIENSTVIEKLTGLQTKDLLDKKIHNYITKVVAP